MIKIIDSIPEEKKKQIKIQINNMFTDEMVQNLANAIHKHYGQDNQVKTKISANESK